MFQLYRFGKNTCIDLEKHDFAISFEITFISIKRSRKDYKNIIKTFIIYYYIIKTESKKRKNK